MNYDDDELNSYYDVADLTFCDDPALTDPDQPNNGNDDTDGGIIPIGIPTGNVPQAPPNTTPTGPVDPFNDESPSYSPDNPPNYQITATPDNSHGIINNPGTSGNPPSSTNPTLLICGNGIFLDKRAKVFRTHDKALWFMWIDEIYSNTTSSSGSSSGSSNTTTVTQSTPTGTFPTGESSTSSTGSSSSSGAAQVDQTVFTVLDPLTEKSITTIALNQGDSILFYTRTLNESFNIPTDPNGVINPNVFWCLWSDGTNLNPIKGLKYFDFWYDQDTSSLDLIFWANVNSDDLKVKNKDMYDSVRNPTLLDGTLDPKAQRVIFWTKGTYKAVITNRQGPSVATGIFIFNKPLMILNPGPKSGNTADSVVDEGFNTRFVELQ